MTLYKKVSCNVTVCKHLLYETNGITEKSDGTWCGKDEIKLDADIELGTMTMECLSFEHKND